MAKQTMERLKNGRYEQKVEWQSTPNGNVAKFWDSNTRKEVFVKEFMKLRYPETTQTKDGKVLPSLVEAKERVDRFCRKTDEINDKIKDIARAGGDVVVNTDFFRDGLRIYKVTDLINLEDWAGSEVKDHLSVEQIDTLMQRLSNALMTLHSADVLHCDLKPENIFIVKDRDGMYVGMLSDFDDSFLMSKVPDSDEIVCTPEYMSPELGYYKLLGGNTPELPLDAASDVFALGLIYHEYLTGEFPEFSDDYSQLFAALLEGEPLKLSSKLDPAHRLLIYRMMTTMPYDRLQSCAEVSREIASIRRRYKTEFTLKVMDGSKPLAGKSLYMYAHFQADGAESEKQSVPLCVVRTDSRGQAVLKGLTECEYTLRLGEMEVPIHWEESGSQGYTATVQMGRVEKYTLKVVHDGKPLSNVKVFLSQFNEAKVKQADFTARTDASGVAEFEDLPGGIYQASVNKVRQSFRWDSSRSHTFQIRTYTIRLMNGTEPVGGKQVELVGIGEKGSKATPVTSNAQGQVVLFNLNVRLKYSIRCDGREIPFEWSADRKAEIQLVRKTRYQISVLMDGTKKPVKNVKVCIGVRRDGKFVKLAEGMTNGQGKVLLGEFEEGEYLTGVTALPTGVKLLKRKVGKAIKVTLSGDSKSVLIKAVPNAEDVILDQDIPQDVSELYSHIVKYRDGGVVLTWRHDGSTVTTRANQLALKGLEIYV